MSFYKRDLLAALLFINSIFVMGRTVESDLDKDDRILFGDEFEILNKTQLSDKCLRCICDGTTDCDYSYETSGNGLFGPFLISHAYWKEAGKHVLAHDDPNRPKAFQDCVYNYECASRTIRGYAEHYIRDCNEDGYVDCDDYSMIHFNGRYECSAALERNVDGREYSRKYFKCVAREYTTKPHL